MGQVPMAAARDDLFPPIFAQLSRNGVPAMGIVISAIFATLLILSQVAGPPGLKTFYDLIVGLSTMAAVIPYAFCALATGLVAANVSGTRPGTSTGCDRVDRLRLLCLHPLWVRRKGGVVRDDHARARYSRLCLAAASRGVQIISKASDVVTRPIQS